MALAELAEQDPPAGPDQPALQVQLVFTVLPIGESEPAGQSSQLPNPAALLNFPATQAVHVDSADAPLALECLPASQSLQAADPVPALNFPSVQAPHCPPSAPDQPAMQMHAASDELPAGEAEFVGHTEHT